jgi:hypothetical protein
MSHDRCCPLEDASLECAVCDAIAAARAEEIEARNLIWKINLPIIERRNYEQGFHDGVELGRKQGCC